MLKCPLCDKKFRTLSWLQNHMKDHLSDGICPACGNKYKSLVRHFSIHRDEDELHMILYGIMGKTNRVNREILQKCKDRAVELLRCD